ncbi:hypothetical protein P7K49_018963 [Saguinus oedipus]|uniref:Matrix Gla protein n=1 Tax=Saguinus oedipus TaxID=9490 RepID=A0ABQ9UW30_SAGOE|nr:hypothetical protein P7K49_018963 [Saguinus oedipus]
MWDYEKTGNTKNDRLEKLESVQSPRDSDKLWLQDPLNKLQQRYRVIGSANVLSCIPSLNSELSELVISTFPAALETEIDTPDPTAVPAQGSEVPKLWLFYSLLLRDSSLLSPKKTTVYPRNRGTSGASPPTAATHNPATDLQDETMKSLVLLAVLAALAVVTLCYAQQSNCPAVFLPGDTWLSSGSFLILFDRVLKQALHKSEKMVLWRLLRNANTFISPQQRWRAKVHERIRERSKPAHELNREACDDYKLCERYAMVYGYNAAYNRYFRQRPGTE